MTGTVFSTPRFRPIDLTGTPLYGAVLTFYVAGSNTVLQPIYADSALSTVLANPLSADATGQFVAIWLDTALQYNVLLTRSDGQQEWLEPNYTPAGSGAGDGGGGTTQGDAGLSVAELVINLRSDTAPPTPSGGSFSFATQTLSPPSGWSSEIPAGAAPNWQSRAVAAVQGVTGTDSLLTWSAPVRALQDGASVDIVFRRNAGQPSTPAPSVDVPSGWYTDVDSVPASTDTLWSSVGNRDHEGSNWIWQLPIQVEGDQGEPGDPGADGILYYVKPTNGTAIKNGTGSLTVEAHIVQGGTDTLLTSGTIQLYVGSTLVNLANGYATGSDGYTGVFDAGDIAGATTVILKDGAAGAAKDTITLVDVADGTADTGKNAVYGYIDASNGLAFTRASDQTTWSPSANTTRLDCTFVQGGSDVARVAWLVTRDNTAGTLTGATTTHGGGDLNSGRVTVTELNETSQAFTVKFAYSNAGDVSSVAETVLTSMAGSDGAVGTGTPGPGALVLAVTKPAIGVMAYQNGGVVTLAAANGQATLYEGVTDRTSVATINAVVATGCTGRFNTAVNTPIAGQPKGYYQIDTLTADTATLALSATYSSNTATTTISIFRSYIGYEIVSTLPVTNLFAGRMVYLTTDAKLYRYNGTAWTRSVDGADITANSITANSIQAGAVTAAKISVTSLSALSANLGTVTAGVLQSGATQASSGATFDLSNARIVFDTAPGQAGTGFVRIQGYGFGPTNQYIDWYGPKPAAQSTHAGIIANLSDASALYFMKTDGSSIDTSRIRGEFETKCWVRFDGKTGGTATIKDRFNVASVTRLSAGVYRITFASALANANYVALSNADLDGDGQNAQLSAANTLGTTQFNVDVRGTGGGHNDAAVVSVIVFGSNVVAGDNVSTPSGGFGGGTIGRGNIP